jgi:cytochrome bd-type quinol oxidase subunit 1
MTDTEGERPQSRFEQARATARAQAAARQSRRAGQREGVQTASKAMVSYLWLVQTYIVRALCLIFIIGAVMDLMGGRTPLGGASIGALVAAVIFAGETWFARVITGWIVRDTGRRPWSGAPKAEAG